MDSIDVAISSIFSNPAHLNTAITINGIHHLVSFLISQFTINFDCKLFWI